MAMVAEQFRYLRLMPKIDQIVTRVGGISLLGQLR